MGLGVSCSSRSTARPTASESRRRIVALTLASELPELPSGRAISQGPARATKGAPALHDGRTTDCSKASSAPRRRVGGSAESFPRAKKCTSAFTCIRRSNHYRRRPMSVSASAASRTSCTAPEPPCADSWVGSAKAPVTGCIASGTSAAAAAAVRSGSCSLLARGIVCEEERHFCRRLLVAAPLHVRALQKAHYLNLDEYGRQLDEKGRHGTNAGTQGCR